jgi:xylan 1,4-beta-xylosidase
MSAGASGAGPRSSLCGSGREFVPMMPSRTLSFSVVALLFLALSLIFGTRPPQTSAQAPAVEVDARAPTHPFPHFWETIFGSGRAILSLRDGYRQDLREVKSVTGMQYVRFHAILHDEVGVYDEDASGHPVYNFSYVDQIYDGLLKNGVRPYIELSFMPRKLASREVLHPFWYHPLTSPPKDWGRWHDLIYQFSKHLVERYGVDEVSQWYFEVWNEPNIDFWAGEPKETSYYHLYDAAASAIKQASPRLRVGGPATAQAAWIDRFIRHCVDNNIPVDFVSTHVYGNDSAQNVFGTREEVPRNRMVCKAAQKVHDQVQASPRPHLPIFWSEYNASYKNEPNVTDAVFMGPWLADTIRQCDGLTDAMAYWTFSDVFEEQGVVHQPFYGGFGLLAEDGLPKPSFNAFKLLHRLGNQRIPADSDSVIATRRADGSLAIVLWNLFLPEATGTAKQITLVLKGLSPSPHAVVQRLDAEHGSLFHEYDKMGRPLYPTARQIELLRQAAALGPPETVPLSNHRISLTLPANGLVLLEIR